MIPQLVSVRVKRPGRRRVRLWVPVVPAALLLAPILVPAVLGGVVACLVYRIDAVRALGTGWRVLCALPGTRFDVEFSGTAVLVAVR
ncbi:hypothetical protein [Nonomuraea typhae]|uniref:Uncharacterized protein n=1 Tax=Nonomuraea typhae TaxID=2603600 RepID=A0ABW7Z7E6_9ACTN